MSKYQWLVMCGVLVLLSACATHKPAPVVELSQAETAPSGPSQQELAERRQQKIRQMLANAQQALADDHLMVPIEDSAYSWYRQVLELEYDTAEAHWGMRQITKRYLQLAEQAYQARRLDQAEQMLQRAERVAASPKQTAAIRDRYKQVKKDNEVLLPVAPLSARDPKVQQQLAEVAMEAKEKQSRLIIVARNDAEGRWIYQQMRAAVEGYRLRGNIELGRVPRVVFLD